MSYKFIRYYRRFKTMVKGKSIILRPKVRNNDMVMVISGKYRNSIGKVISRLSGTNFVIVDSVGINRDYKDKSTGEFASKFIHAKIHLSNVMHYDVIGNVASRTKVVLDDTGKRRLVYVKTGNYVPSNYLSSKTNSTGRDGPSIEECKVSDEVGSNVDNSELK